MKRAFAFVGLVYFAVQMLAAFLPPEAFLSLTVIFVLIFIITALPRCKFDVHIPVFFAACAAALLLRGAYFAVNVLPARALIGQTKRVSAVVCDAVPYYGDTLKATLSVKVLDGKKLILPTKVFVNNMDGISAGDRVETELLFVKNENTGNFYNYSKGVFVSAKSIESDISVTRDKGLLSFFRRLQTSLGKNIKMQLGGERGNIAAAISVGDKAGLAFLTKDEFKAAGVSHILVVSGMHLSAAGAFAFALGKLLFARRRAAAGFGAVVTVLFMLLMGFTPSVVRAGIALLLVYLGIIASKVPDTLTSIGLAALILSIANPYAAVDIGLLLSFTATLGILICMHLMQRLKEKPFFEKHSCAHKVLSAVAVPCFAALGTLPVQLAFGMGISLLCIICNLLCVPLLPVTTLSAFALAFIPTHFHIIALPFKLICSVCIYLLQLVTHGASVLPWGFVYIGSQALVPIILLYLLFYMGMRFKTRYMPIWLSVFAIIGVVAQMLLSYGLVYIELADYSKAPPILICQGGSSALIIQSSAKTNYISKAMQRHNLQTIDTVIDLRCSDKNAELGSLTYGKYIKAEKEIVNNDEICVSDDIMIYVKHQNKGIAACVDIKGYKLALNSGDVDYSAYSPVDIYIAGNTAPQWLCARQYLSGRDMPRWLAQGGSNTAYTAMGVTVRPGKSVRIQRDMLLE